MPDAQIYHLLATLEHMFSALRAERWAAIDPDDHEAGLAAYKPLADATRAVEAAIGQLRPLLRVAAEEAEDAEVPAPAPPPALPEGVTGPHPLTDDFTHTRPVAFAWEGVIYKYAQGLPRRTHRAVYEWVLRRLFQQDAARLRACVGAPGFVSPQHHPDFATTAAPLRDACQLAPDLFAEVNLSANNLAHRLRHLLAHFGYPPDTLRLWVRPAPAADAG